MCLLTDLPEAEVNVLQNKLEVLNNILDPEVCCQLDAASSCFSILVIVAHLINDDLLIIARITFSSSSTSGSGTVSKRHVLGANYFLF